jgi:tyrosine-protein kinase Etk/Wzc
MSFIERSPNMSTDADMDTVNLAEAWHALARRRGTILAITCAALALGAAFVLTAHPRFTLVGSLYTRGLQPSASANTGGGGPGANYLESFQSISDSETQVDLLTSPLLVQQAVLETGMNTAVTSAASAPPRYWKWRLADHGSAAAFAPQPNDLKALFTNFDDPSIATARYTIRFGAAGHYQISQNGQPVLTGTLGTPAAGGGLRLLLAPQYSGFVPATNASYGLYVANPVETARTLTAGPLSVTPGGTATLPSDIINITFSGPDPYRDQNFVNTLMSDYIATIVSWNSTAAGGMVSFINHQLTDVQSRLTAANTALAQYQTRTGILSPPDNAKDIIDQQAQYATQQAQMQIRLSALQQISDALRKAPNGVNPYMLSQTTDPALSDLAEQLARDEAALAALRVGFTGNAPEVQAQQAQIWELDYAINSLVATQLAEARDNLATNTAVMAALQKKIQTMPAQSLQVLNLTRASDVLGQLYVGLMQKQQDAALSQAAQVSATRVITQAQLPFNASAPRPLVVMAFALVLGLLAGCGWVLGRRAVSDQFESESEIRRLVKLAVYGLVPQRPKSDGEKLLAGHSYGSFAESFRLIRNNIYHAIPGKQSKIILLTSAAVDDGKSTMAANLAKALADDGKRVLLIDADLRKGRIAASLGLELSPGLSDWLVGGEKVPVQTPPGERFAVLTSGVRPPNPAELLNEIRLNEILRALRPDYDFIIFDSAPLPLVSDALILARHADLTLSVLFLGRARHREMMLHEHTLGVLTSHVGLIINGAGRPVTGYDAMYGEVSVPAVAARRVAPAVAARETI